MNSLKRRATGGVTILNRRSSQSVLGAPPPSTDRFKRTQYTTDDLGTTYSYVCSCSGRLADYGSLIRNPTATALLKSCVAFPSLTEAIRHLPVRSNYPNLIISTRPSRYFNCLLIASEPFVNAPPRSLDLFICCIIIL